MKVLIRWAPALQLLLNCWDWNCVWNIAIQWLLVKIPVFVEEKNVQDYGIAPFLFYETTVVSALNPQFQPQSSNTKGLQFFQGLCFLNQRYFLISLTLQYWHLDLRKKEFSLVKLWGMPQERSLQLRGESAKESSDKPKAWSLFPFIPSC